MTSSIRRWVIAIYNATGATSAVIFSQIPGPEHGGLPAFSALRTKPGGLIATMIVCEKCPTAVSLSSDATLAAKVYYLMHGRTDNMESEGKQIDEDNVEIVALDGYLLGGVYFIDRTFASDSNLVAILACGGGIPATKYRQFARFLAGGGIPTLTFDYRGIGRSRRGGLRGFSADVEDWSENDCGGAIAWLRRAHTHDRIVAITHSIGALLLGGAPNATQIARGVLVCAHTGYFGDYRIVYRLPMALMWHGIMPGLTKIIGYFPARRLGLGEDIPAGVALAWASRRKPVLSGVSVGPRAARLLKGCSELYFPAMVRSDRAARVPHERPSWRVPGWLRAADPHSSRSLPH